MSKSIIDNNNKRCYLCGHTGETVKYYCIPNKTAKLIKRAEDEGMFVYLCKDHPFRFREHETCEGCCNFVERDATFKRMIIGIGVDKWKDNHKATYEDYVKVYGER